MINLYSQLIEVLLPRTQTDDQLQEGDVSTTPTTMEPTQRYLSLNSAFSTIGRLKTFIFNTKRRKRSPIQRRDGSISYKDSKIPDTGHTLPPSAARQMWSARRSVNAIPDSVFIEVLENSNSCNPILRALANRLTTLLER